MVCMRYTRIGVGSSLGAADAVLIRLRCKQWTCEYCAGVNKKQWQARLIEGLKALGGNWSFWTLTHDLSEDTPLKDQRTHLSSCWNRLLTRIRRETPSDHDLAYVRVLEIGSNNTQRMHVHALLNLHISDARIVTRDDGSQYSTSDTYRPMVIRSRFGYIHDLKNVTSDVSERPVHEQAIYASSYVTKYMSKLSSAVAYPKYTRRFSVSRNFPQLTDDEMHSSMEWRVVQRLNMHVAMMYWSQGMHIHDIQTGQRVTDDQFSQAGFWRDPLAEPDSTT